MLSTSTEPRTAGRRTLTPRLAYAHVAAVIGLALFASGTPSALYGTYRELWGFSPLVLTLVYSVYAFGVLAALLLAGRLSDEVGRRPVLLVALGTLLAATAVFMFADNGRKALIALVACLVAVPAFCVGLPALALAGVFKEAPVNGTLTMAESPGGRYVVVKSTFDTDAGRETRLYVRTDSLFLGREAPTPLARCAADPFDEGLPPEAVRFTSETTVAVPVQGEEDTTVVRFDPDTLVPERTVNMCASN